MENQRLFLKYSKGKHWKNHPTSYVDYFTSFLWRNVDKKTLSHNFEIADLGSGTGRDVNRFHQCQFAAIGLDNNSDACQTAKNECNYSPHAFYLCDIEHLPFLDNSRWAYFCINVMHYVDQEKVLGEIYRTLKPGGYAFIHFNLLIIDDNYSIDYNQKKSDVYEMVKKFEIVEEKIFMREDSLPVPHTHHVMQVILKKH